MEYHIRVSTKSEKRDETKLSLSLEQLTEDYLNRYVAGQPLLINGRSIGADDVTRLRITKSEKTVNELRREVEIEDARSNVVFFGGPSKDWRAADKAEDCSDGLLRKARLVENTRQKGVVEVDVPLERKKVFVVHGRDDRLRSDVFAFLRSIHLEPIEWEQARAATGKSTPYVGEILDAGFRMAGAVVVIFSGDDVAMLCPELQNARDKDSYESKLTPQPRPNVILEAGIALGQHQDRTVILEFGQIRPISDLAGRHILRMDNSAGSRKSLVERLRTAGCEVDDSGSEWLAVGNLAPSPVEVSPSESEGDEGYGEYELDLLVAMLQSGRACIRVHPTGRIDEHVVVGDVLLGCYDERDDVDDDILEYVLALIQLENDFLVEEEEVGSQATRYVLTPDGFDTAKEERKAGRALGLDEMEHAAVTDCD